MTEKTIDNLRDRKILIEHMNGKSLKSREHTLEITKIRGASQIVANKFLEIPDNMVIPIRKYPYVASTFLLWPCGPYDLGRKIPAGMLPIEGL